VTGSTSMAERGSGQWNIIEHDGRYASASDVTRRGDGSGDA